MPNPHGNPEIKKYAFKTERKEPLVERLNIRIPKSMKERLQVLENYPEFVRQAIWKALNELDNLEDDL